MGLKQGAIGNTLEETHWELVGNLKGTRWEQRENEKKAGGGGGGGGGAGKGKQNQ